MDRRKGTILEESVAGITRVGKAYEIEVYVEGYGSETRKFNVPIKEN